MNNLKSAKENQNSTYNRVYTRRELTIINEELAEVYKTLIDLKIQLPPLPPAGRAIFR